METRCSVLRVLLKTGSHHTSRVRCRGPNTACGGASPRGRRSPPSGPSTGPGPSPSRGLGRTETCRQSDRPDTAECRDTRRLRQDKTYFYKGGTDQQYIFTQAFTRTQADTHMYTLGMHQKLGHFHHSFSSVITRLS